MITKFVEEFIKETQGKFNMLKFSRASYDKTGKNLTIKFLISVYETRKFDEEEKKEVLDVCKKLFSGINVSVEYQKTYADEAVVKNKIIEFFNKNSPLIYRHLKDGNILITVDLGSEIRVKLLFDTPLYNILKADDLLERLGDFLDHTFTESIEIETEENVVDLNSSAEEEDVELETTIVDYSAARIVKIEKGKTVYSRGKIKGIPHQPGYIVDIKAENPNVVLCGKISLVSKYMYSNPKHKTDPNAPEKLPLVKFMLDDTTGKIACVSFPQNENEAKKIEDLIDGTTVVCAGKVAKSNYDGNLNFTVWTIVRCEIDFDSIDTVIVKPAPKRYTTVFPKQYVEDGQKSLLDDEKPIPDYFKGKTFVVYDLEATDKVTSTAQIIEIAACKIVDGVKTQTFQTLVKPPCAISQEIIELTHIDNLMVANAPTIEQVMPDFYKFTRDAILVGHNIAGYDFPLIKIFADQMGYIFDNDMQDTLILARTYLTELPNFRLETISKTFGISHENAHRAMSDVLATCEAFRIIAERMK